MGEISLENITKSYGDIVAVSDLGLEIEDGEFLVLVGPSGCGKSTTLRMIAGLEEITDGTISINQRVVNDLEPKERDIAMVFQNYALYPHKTVRENIGFGLKYSSTLSKPEIDERVENAAEMMGIEELLDEKPGQLSGGQRQRVALGRAIVREPEAFLFDEPLSNLDAKLRTRMRTEITQLQNDLGVTSIYVTHDQAEAMTMGDRIAILDDGELQQIGEPDDVYDHPANKFVAGFIGSPSMNFLDVKLTERNGTKMLVGRQNESVSFDLDEELLGRLDVSVGESFSLGVRPEDVQVVRDPSGWEPGRLLDATVKVVEPMGSDNFLNLEIGQGDQWIARTDATYKPNLETTVAITFDHSALHLFDEEGTTVKSQGTGTESFHERDLTARPQ